MLPAAGFKAAVTARFLQTMGMHTQNSPDPTVGSHDYFTGVDNVLEITIVTADGNHVIANSYRNKDLFWALRGGGGGCEFSHLQNPPLHSFLCCSSFGQLHQRHLNPELAHGDHSSHSLASRRARLWRLWFPICRGVHVQCPITQRHGRTDPGHFLSAF